MERHWERANIHWDNPFVPNAPFLYPLSGMTMAKYFSFAEFPLLEQIMLMFTEVPTTFRVRVSWQHLWVLNYLHLPPAAESYLSRKFFVRLMLCRNWKIEKVNTYHDNIQKFTWRYIWWRHNKEFYEQPDILVKSVLSLEGTCFTLACKTNAVQHINKHSK